MKKPESLPCNTEAEVAVLGAILLNNDCFNQAASMLSEEDFSLDSHRRIYRAMRELMDYDRNVDYITLTAHLGENGVNRCGGVAYVTSLTDGLPRVKKLYSPVILSGAGATATAQSKLSRFAGV